MCFPYNPSIYYIYLNFPVLTVARPYYILYIVLMYYYFTYTSIGAPAFWDQMQIRRTVTICAVRRLLCCNEGFLPSSLRLLD